MLQRPLTRRDLTAAVAVTPGVVFAAVAFVLQLADGVDWTPSDPDDFTAIIAASFGWVLVGPVLLPLFTLVGWMAIRRAEPNARQTFWIATLVSVVGYLLMLEFMRLS
jgi:hypothetical protein